MKKTKTLSMLLAGVMLSAAALPCAAAEELPSVSAQTIDFKELEVNSAKTNFVSHPYALRIGNDSNVNEAQGNAKLYKLGNVFGLGEDEYAVEMVAREQRQYRPFMLLGEYNKEYSLNEDFYIQANMYIGEARETDYFRLGGEYHDGSARHTQYVYFQGNGRVQDTNREQDTRYGGAYLPNNWYNVTIAFDKDAMTTSLYIDGKLFDLSFAGTDVRPFTVNEGIKNLIIGARMEKRGTADNGGLPSWLLMESMDIVPQTYVPADTDTSVSSDVYDTAANSLFIQSSATADKAQAYVAGVADTTTVSEFLANVNVPENALKSVVKIDEYSKQTTQVPADETIDDDMQLLVKSADGSRKLYDIRVNVSEENLPVITSEKYTIDGGTISVTPHTSVSALLENIKAGEGTTFKLVGINGAQITDGYVLTDSMSVVASKGANSVVYALKLKDTYVLNTASSLKSLVDGSELFKATLPASAGVTSLAYTTHITYNKAGANSRLYGMGSGGANAYYGTAASDYVVTKDSMPQSKEPAYKIDTEYDGWVQHPTGTDLAAKSSAAQGKLIVYNYKTYLEAGASTMMFTYKQMMNNSGTSIPADAVYFADGSIYLGKEFGGSALKGNSIKIGSYENNKEYEVTMVQQAFDTNKNEIVIEGIYLDGNKIFPTEEQAGDDGFYHISYSASSPVYALRSAIMATKGKAYWGNLNIYMADDYNIPEKETVTDVTITSLDPTVEVYEADPLANNMPTIKGYSGTAGDLCAVLDSAIGTELKIFDRTGTAAVNDSMLLEADMIVRVLALNNSNVAYYTLSDLINMGSFKAEFAENVILKRTIKAYKDEDLKAALVIASYDENKNLIGVDIDSKTIADAGTYELSAQVALGADSYKAMLIDNDLRPYCNAAEYSSAGEIIQ